MKLLEQHLRGLGWENAIYLRPTLAAVNKPDPALTPDRIFVQGWDELNTLLGVKVPHLCVGFSFGGLLAAFTPGPVRLSVCSPWGRLPEEAIHRAASREGWQVLQGGADTVVPPEPNLAVLPKNIFRTIDPHGSHDFDTWMERIAAWVVERWENHQTPRIPAPKAGPHKISSPPH